MRLVCEKECRKGMRANFYLKWEGYYDIMFWYIFRKGDIHNE